MAKIDNLKDELFVLNRLNRKGVVQFDSTNVQQRIKEVEDEIECYDGEEDEQDEEDNREEVEKDRRSICYSQGLYY